MNNIKDQITELNQNYNDLGEDLLLLEAVILATQRENEFPPEYVLSSLDRVMTCLRQHTEDICLLAKQLRKRASPARQKVYPRHCVQRTQQGSRL